MPNRTEQLLAAGGLATALRSGLYIKQFRGTSSHYPLSTRCATAWQSQPHFLLHTPALSSRRCEQADVSDSVAATGGVTGTRIYPRYALPKKPLLFTSTNISLAGCSTVFDYFQQKRRFTLEHVYIPQCLLNPRNLNLSYTDMHLVVRSQVPQCNVVTFKPRWCD